MVFSNAKTVVINNQEVDSIILSDGGVLYEAKNMSLTLSYSPSTVYYGDTVALNVTLTGRDVANKTIVLYASEVCFISNEYFTSNRVDLITDSNGVVSTNIVCTGFSSLTVTASYNDLSDSVNITVNDKYDLDLVSDKDVLSYNDNDTATLTATLTKNGVGVENEEITFYEQENYVNNLGTFSLTKPYYCCNFPYEEGYEGSMYMTHYDGSIIKKTIMSVVGTVPKIKVTDVKTHAIEDITLGKPILLIQNKQVYYYDTNNVLKQVYGFSNCGDIRINKSNTYLYSYSKVNSDNNGNATYEYTSNSSDDVKIIAKWDELSKSQIIHNL